MEYALFFFYKNSVFHGHAGVLFFSADFRLEYSYDHSYVHCREEHTLLSK